MTYLPYINDVFQCNLTCLIDFAYKGFIIKTLFLWAFLFTSNIEVSNDLFPKNKSLKIMLICIDRADYSYRYQLQPICSSNRPDYAYCRCIVTALPTNTIGTMLNQL